MTIPIVYAPLNPWRQWLLRCLTLVICLAGAASVQAQLTTNLFVDSKSLTLGNAVTADPPGISAIHFNPAGLSRLKGKQYQLNLVGAFLKSETKITAPADYQGVFGFTDDPVINTTSEPSDKTALYIPGLGLQKIENPIPALVPINAAPIGFGISVNPPGSKLTFANALYPQMLVPTARDSDDSGRYAGTATVLERVTYLSPTVSYQINDQWAVGLSINFSYMAFAYEITNRVPNVFLGLIRSFQETLCQEGLESLDIFGLCGGVGIGPFVDLTDIEIEAQDTLSPGYNIGLMWEPTETFAWGLVYQSEQKNHLTGTFHIDYADVLRDFFRGVRSAPLGALIAQILDLPSFPTKSESARISMDLIYPQHIQTGIRYRFLPDWQVNFDVGWTEWSKFNELKAEFDRPLEVLKLTRTLAQGSDNAYTVDLGWEDAWNYGVGLTYFYSDQLDLRIGYEPRASAVPDDKVGFGIPQEAQLYGFGVGLHPDENTDIDFNFAYLYADVEVKPGQSSNSTGEGLTDPAPYAGLNLDTTLRSLFIGLNYRSRF